MKKLLRAGLRLLHRASTGAVGRGNGTSMVWEKESATGNAYMFEKVAEGIQQVCAECGRALRVTAATTARLTCGAGRELFGDAALSIRLIAEISVFRYIKCVF